MNRTPVAVLVAIAIAVAACGSGDAADDTTTALPIGGPYPVADLSFIVEHPDRDTIEYRVVCLGDTATVTPDDAGIDEQAACLALADPAVVTRLVEGPPADQVCTEQYGGPDVATITGTIDDQPIDATIDRTNGCGIADWDDLLVDLLPPALGVTE